MCIEFFSRICCNKVSLNEDEYNVLKNMNPVTRRFLAKRRSIINCLTTLIFVDVLITITIIIMVFAGTSIMTIAGNTTDVINGVILITVFTIYLIIDLIQYQLIKKWLNSWSNYKNGIYYSKCMVVLIYLIYPIISFNTYANNTEGITIKLFLDMINTLICVISAIHVFILKSNTLIKEVGSSYEYRTIAIVAKAIYIPIVIIVFILLINYTGDPLIISFMSCYFATIMVSLVINNTFNEILEDIFSLGCLMLLAAIIINYDVAFLSIVFKIYINYLITSVVAIDLLNEWVMKNRENITEMIGEDSITQIMKDINKFENTDGQQLIHEEKDSIASSVSVSITPSIKSSAENKKDSYESIDGEPDML